MTDVQVQELLQTKCDKLETDDRCKAFPCTKAYNGANQVTDQLKLISYKLQWAMSYTVHMVKGAVDTMVLSEPDFSFFFFFFTETYKEQQTKEGFMTLSC